MGRQDPEEESPVSNTTSSSNVSTVETNLAIEQTANSFKSFPHFSTDAIHAGQHPDRWPSCGVVPSISMATTFKQAEPRLTNKRHFYGRLGNPTRDATEECMATLEGAKYCSAFASGMAAINAMVQLSTHTGDEVIAMDDLYGGTNQYFRRIAASHAGIITHFLALDHPDEKFVAELMRCKLSPKTRLVWIETPTNPKMRMVDIEMISRLAHLYRPDIIVAVDNTFMTPYFQRPLLLGADVVAHSCTKYLNGHSDVIMGALMTNNALLADRIKFQQFASGGIPSPFDCYLLNRGLKTLAVRMERHMQNGLAVARALEANTTRVEKVIHPGLESYEQRALSLRQCRGYSGMLGFYIKNGTVVETRKFLKALRIWTLAVSLGGYESLAEVPCLMTHASVPADQRKELGITDNYVRLSVGLEDVQDLIDDLQRALVAAFSEEKEIAAPVISSWRRKLEESRRQKA